MRTDDLLGKSFILDFIHNRKRHKSNYDTDTRYEVTITAVDTDTIRIDYQDGKLCGCPNPKMRGYRAQITQIRRAVFLGEVFVVPSYISCGGAICSIKKEVIE